jgi:hypothetical protein
VTRARTYDGEIYGDILIGFDDGTPTSKRAVPKNFVLLKYGLNDYTIDGEDGVFNLEPLDAKAIVAEFNKRGKHLVIDYDHGTIKKDAAVRGDAPASGWIKRMMLTPVGIEVETSWTDKARDYLGNGEYRYHSSVIQFDKKTKRPKAIQSVALTNHPAVHGSEALVAANDSTKTINDNKETNMDPELFKFAEEIADQIKKLKGLMVRAFNDMKSSAKTEADITAFNDAKTRLLALADEGSEIPVVESAPVSGKTIDEMRNWIQAQLDADPKPNKSRRDELDSALIVLDEYSSEEAPAGEVSETPVAESTEVPADPITTEPVSGSEIPADELANLGLSDLGLLLGLSDTTDKSKIKTEIIALNDYKVKTERFLKTQNVKNLDEIAMKLILSESEKKATVIETAETIALNDSKLYVETLILNGTLDEKNREWAVDSAHRDRKAFNDFVSKMPKNMRTPVSSTLALNDGSSLAKPSAPKVAEHSKEALEVAKLFGRKADDVYGKFTDAAGIAALDPIAPENKKKEVAKPGSFSGSFE